MVVACVEQDHLRELGDGEDLGCLAWCLVLRLTVCTVEGGLVGLCVDDDKVRELSGLEVTVRARDVGAVPAGFGRSFIALVGFPLVDRCHGGVDQ